MHRAFLMRAVLCLLLSIGSLPPAPAQSKKALMTRHRKAKAELAATRATWTTLQDLVTEYKQLDELPRIVWGAVPLDQVGEQPLELDGRTYKLLLFDLDGDKVADEYGLNDEQGQAMRAEFGFLYDADGNGRVDRVIYNAGVMMDPEGDMKYLFHHWADLNADGRIDARTNPYFLLGQDSLPDFRRVLLIRDTDFDGRVNSMEVLDLQQEATLPWAAKDEVWTFRTVFGEQEIPASEEDVFRFENTILQAILSHPASGTSPSP